MLATTIHGTRDIRFGEVSDPTLQAPTDAIVKVTERKEAMLKQKLLDRQEMMGRYLLMRQQNR